MTLLALPPPHLERLWPLRADRYWAAHTDRNSDRACHACGSTFKPEVHHLRYEWRDGVKTGHEHDCWLVGLCRPCHRELHYRHRAKCRRWKSMHGMTVTRPRRYYRSLTRYSIRFIRRERWLHPWRRVPHWMAPSRSER